MKGGNVVSEQEGRNALRHFDGGNLEPFIRLVWESACAWQRSSVFGHYVYGITTCMRFLRSDFPRRAEVHTRVPVAGG